MKHTINQRHCHWSESNPPVIQTSVCWCVCYLWAGLLRCCTNGLCALQKSCGGAACPPPAFSLSSCRKTGSRRAQLPQTAGPPLAAASPSQQTRPAAASCGAATQTSHLHRGWERQHISLWRGPKFSRIGQGMNSAGARLDRVYRHASSSETMVRPNELHSNTKQQP